MVQSVVRVQVDSKPEEVARIVSKYDLLSVPVVDLRNRLVGAGRRGSAAPRRRRCRRESDFRAMGAMGSGLSLVLFFLL